MEDFVPNFDSLIKLENCFKDVVYHDKDHTYTIGGKLARKSVTGLISKYTKPFDVKKMAKHVANKEGVEVSDIIEKWDFVRDYANHKGKEFHLFVENFLNRKKILINRKEIQKFFDNHSDFASSESVDNYYKEFAKMVKNFYSFYEKEYAQNYITIKSEFVVGDAVSNIAGTIDNLSFNKKTQELEIFDYKTNAKFQTENKYGETLLPPLEHLENCEYHKYSLQISIYRLLIERNTPYNVGAGYILWFRDEEFKKYPILDLKKEAVSILDN